MSEVRHLVTKAAKLGHPAMALTDHGHMAGTVQLYKACKDQGILPYPAVEAYLVPEHEEWDGKASRYHLGLIALSLKGYRALIKLVSRSYTRPQFNRFPRIDWNDLALLSQEARDDIALTTGCYFGLPIQTLVTETVDPVKGLNFGKLSNRNKARSVVQTYARLFPNTYVELQNHYTPHPDNWTDEQICTEMFGIAQELGLPVVVTQDTHYLDVRHSSAHTLMKRSTYGGMEDGFPGDSYHFASTRFIKNHHQAEHWEAAQEGFTDLLDRHRVSLPALDTFRAHIPEVTTDPLKGVTQLVTRRLQDLASTGLLAPSKGRSGKPAETLARYQERLDHELEVIEYLNIAGYFALVRQIVLWCQRNGVFVEARGSANGSLVCFLLGITQVDPLRWGTSFERFLSKDRKKPPDVDLDVSYTERKRLLEYISSHFPTQQIGTFQQLGTNDEGQGSVMVTYKAGIRKQLGDDTKALNDVKTVEDVKWFRPQDYQALKYLSEMEVKRSYGVHAAGLLISAPSLKMEDYVPTMLVASSNTKVTQFVGNDLEEFGFCKIDILGQITLTAMMKCQELIGGEHAEKTDDFSWIPFDDKKTMATIGQGRLDTGIFHFDKFTKARGARDMQPRNTMELCLAQGLFLPGAMDTGQTAAYLKRRKMTREERQADIEYIHPAWEHALAKTYGTVIFQEQVIDILRELGMSIEAINIFFKLVKDSASGSLGRNAERMKVVKAEFDKACHRNGIEDADAAYHSFAGLIAYAFNFNHAVGYGIRAYRTAYLKTHYPLEYMTALLNYAGSEMEPKYVVECRRIGIRILPPDINLSGASWSMDKGRNAIRRGLGAVKGIGPKAATDLVSNQPFKSVKDVYLRCGRSVTGGDEYMKTKNPQDLIGTMKVLLDSGAFESSFGISRYS
jgi:DNA-directed DNA polymerase III (polc)